MNPAPKKKLAYLVSHPIQYQAPLLRILSRQPDFQLDVLFESDFSSGEYFDTGFGKSIQWDIPLKDGYSYSVLNNFQSSMQTHSVLSKLHKLQLFLKRKRPRFLWIHGYGNWFYISALILAKAMGIRTLIRDEATDFSQHRNPAKVAAKKLLFRFLDFVVDAFLVIGTLNRSYFIQNGIKPHKLFLVPYAVDNQFFQQTIAQSNTKKELLRRKLGIATHFPVILFAGKLQQRKRPHDLLEAFFNLSDNIGLPPEAYLVFAGDGEQKTSLERAVQKKGWRNILLPGFVNQTELPHYYHLCDLFVLPSDHEPWGLVVNEAMNAGKAILVSDQVGAGPDLVHPGKNGFIFKTGNVQDLACKLRLALQDQRALAEMGHSSTNLIAKWSYKEDVEGIRKALESLDFKTSANGTFQSPKGKNLC